MAENIIATDTEGICICKPFPMPTLPLDSRATNVPSAAPSAEPFYPLANFIDGLYIGHLDIMAEDAEALLAARKIAAFR